MRTPDFGDRPTRTENGEDSRENIRREQLFLRYSARDQRLTRSLFWRAKKPSEANIPDGYDSEGRTFIIYMYCSVSYDNPVCSEHCNNTTLTLQ